MMADFRKHVSSFIMDTVHESESEDDKISSASANSFDLEMPIEYQEGSCKVNGEMAPKPKRQRKVRESEFDINADQEINETEFSVKKKSCVKKGGPRSLWTTEMLDDLVDIITNNERYKRKLIFTNCPTASNAEIYKEIVIELR